ncbi:beta-hexosaminidase subunit beta-like [Haemaphysalis longicornis]
MERYRDRLIFGGCVAHHSNDAWPARLRHLTRIGLAKRGTTKTPASATGAWMGALNIKLTNRCEDMPHADMDETYRLVLTSSGPSTLTARSAWGVIRGLESFSQLVQRYNATHFSVNETVVEDAPRFPHRGLLIDTGRHFLPVVTIIEMLDAMAYNKMNVLHWHIVDDQSFSFVSRAFPNISERGAFNPKTHVYRASDVARVVREAADRGIRVVPEFDSPGHTKSWGKAFPGLVAKCEEKVGHSVRKAGLLNPSKTATFTFLARLLAEVARIFPDEYIHLGGDLPKLVCGKLDMKPGKTMKTMNISRNYDALLRLYFDRLLKIAGKLRKSPVVWQEVFTSKVRLPQDAIVQLWRPDRKHTALLRTITARGHRVVASACWDLQAFYYVGNWEKLYLCDPEDFPGTDHQKALVIGGEVCVWGQQVDRTNIMSQTWPAASLAAERLWSLKEHTDVDTARIRLDKHRCRMLKRGLEVRPLTGPGYCECDFVA